MAVKRFDSRKAPEQTEELLLNFGMANTYRVFSLDELAVAFPDLGTKAVQKGLDHLVKQGLLTNLTGRYRFKRAVSSRIVDREH
ncbi:MAG: hypothetical protein DMF61_24420 [Blastocatellia bacterium AA13]|nr:MAG: hypothetical protein DMF61_24420 [Blastocatellia bacterium AA13]